MKAITGRLADDVTSTTGISGQADEEELPPVSFYDFDAKTIAGRRRAHVKSFDLCPLQIGTMKMFPNVRLLSAELDTLLRR